tara:strand:+ start:2808 stop:3530 length:723 start_codon:yes stop_codon:yes gene_type:complete
MTQARDVADGKFTNTTLTIDSGSDNANTLLLSDGAADANIVDGFVTSRHHSSSEEPVLMIQGRSTSSENIVLIGGTHNNTTYNTATSIKFFTASGYTNTTPVEKMRVTGDGLTFNGDTAAANALDDYEEGTFTPVIQHNTSQNPTFTSANGNYTKIGNTVTCQIRVDGGNTGTAGTFLTITGLPFAVSQGQSNQTIGIWGSNPSSQVGNVHGFNPPRLFKGGTDVTTQMSFVTAMLVYKI